MERDSRLTFSAGPSGKKKRDVVRTSRLVDTGAGNRQPGYFGGPCTASVTTARVSDGASISRKV